MKPELIQEALEGDWRPLWLPVAIDAPSEEVEIQPCRCLPLTEADAPGSKPSLLEGLAAEKGAEALPAVQRDAITRATGFHMYSKGSWMQLHDPGFQGNHRTEENRTDPLPNKRAGLPLLRQRGA